jgi:protease I
MARKVDRYSGNTMKDLKGKRVAIMATDGFEQSELTEPLKRLQEAGAECSVVSPKSGEIKGWDGDDWGDTVPVDKLLSECSPDDFDALVLPGGQINPDKLRMEEGAVRFVKEFVRSAKPTGAICHGPWLLVEADVVRGRRVTSYESIKTDMRNAGADWVDEEVVVDNGLVTSRKPDDLPAFCEKLIEEIAEGRHSPTHKRGGGASMR